AQDLPDGWYEMFRDFLAYMPKRLKEYEGLVLKNRIFRDRTEGVGVLSIDDAVDWGVTGPNLRACGLDWDLRKKRPYGGYEQFDFDVPTGKRGDSYDRGVMRAEEIRQSMRIIQQCMDNMPPGDYKSRHTLTTPPLKHCTMEHIETLITHFLGVSWGPVIPAGEAAACVEGAKGLNTYYLVSDGGTSSYRTRIRAASFPHMQILPQLCRGLMVADLITILGSIDFVLGDVDR
ncbi:MAG: NADH-quinone oxidoreductase subunit C/D, partial [Planctomycetaceae bacterium]